MVGYYIDDIKEFILGLNQEKCFETVFEEGIPRKKIVSPFRNDRKPGCFFSRYEGILYFVDFAEVKSHLNCIEFLAKKENKTTTEIIYDLIKGNKFNSNVDKHSFIKYNTTTKISIVKRKWSKEDKLFWEKYGITKKQLIEDNVVPLRSFTITKNNNSKTIYPTNISYGYIIKDRIKIYSPYSIYKFITNCGNNSIGGTKLTKGELLVITKSYKDHRVILNSGMQHVIWFQNEKILPSENFIKKVGKNYKNIVIFYDNDATGISGSNTIALMFNKYFSNKAYPLYFPSKFPYKDPSDFVTVDVKECQDIIYKLIINTIKKNNYEN